MLEMCRYVKTLMCKTARKKKVFICPCSITVFDVEVTDNAGFKFSTFSSLLVFIIHHDCRMVEETAGHHFVINTN